MNMQVVAMFVDKQGAWNCVHVHDLCIIDIIKI